MRNCGRWAVDDVPFGPFFSLERGNWRDAVKVLMERQTGEVPAALAHPAAPDIASVYGNPGTGLRKGYGLSKIAFRHPEVPGDLQARLPAAFMIVSNSDNSIKVESDADIFVISLDCKGDPKTWLLTGDKKQRSAEKSMGSDDRLPIASSAPVLFLLEHDPSSQADQDDDLAWRTETDAIRATLPGKNEIRLNEGGDVSVTRTVDDTMADLDAERGLRDALAELIFRLHEEHQLMLETDPVRVEMAHHRKVLADATAGERGGVEQLIAGEIQLKAARDASDKFGQQSLDFLRGISLRRGCCWGCQEDGERAPGCETSGAVAGQGAARKHSGDYGRDIFRAGRRRATRRHGLSPAATALCGRRHDLWRGGRHGRYGGGPVIAGRVCRKRPFNGPLSPGSGTHQRGGHPRFCRRRDDRRSGLCCRQWPSRPVRTDDRQRQCQWRTRQ